VSSVARKRCENDENDLGGAANWVARAKEQPGAKVAGWCLPKPSTGNGLADVLSEGRAEPGFLEHPGHDRPLTLLSRGSDNTADG
jgi:hypothetical protein